MRRLCLSIVFFASVALAGPQRVAVSSLRPADKMRLNAVIAQHRMVRLQLAPSDQALLDRLTGNVKRQIFTANPPNLLAYATQVVNRTIPTLTAPEASIVVSYVLDGIAAGDGMGGAGGSDMIGSAAGGDSQSQLLAATKQMQETQMSFDLQYLQLQSQMQSQNRSYSAVSNVMQLKHDTVKNSIGNIR